MPQGQTGSLIREQRLGKGPPLEGTLVGIQPLQQGLLVFPQEQRPRAILKLFRFSVVALSCCCFVLQTFWGPSTYASRLKVDSLEVPGWRESWGSRFCKPFSYTSTYQTQQTPKANRRKYAQMTSTHDYSKAVCFEKFPFTKTWKLISDCLSPRETYQKTDSQMPKCRELRAVLMALLRTPPFRGSAKVVSLHLFM